MTDAFHRPNVGAAAWRAQSSDSDSGGPAIIGGEPGTVSARPRGGEIERAIPAGQQIADSLRRVVTIVRSSVPLRTVVFVLPPVLLPLALGLPLGNALVVTLLLLWLAGAAAVLATVMFDGSDQLALRAIERRLDKLADAPLSSDNEALMAIGAQLDAMSDRIDELGSAAASAPEQPSPAPDMHHRPQEHWSSAPGGDHNDRYDYDVVPERPWSRPRWQQ